MVMLGIEALDRATIERASAVMTAAVRENTAAGRFALLLPEGFAVDPDLADPTAVLGAAFTDLAGPLIPGGVRRYYLLALAELQHRSAPPMFAPRQDRPLADLIAEHRALREGGAVHLLATLDGHDAGLLTIELTGFRPAGYGVLRLIDSKPPDQPRSADSH